MLKLMIGVVIATVIVVFAFTVIKTNTGNSFGTTNSIQIVDENHFQIQVTGQVVKPGTYVMKSGETMFDLIMAAGGTTTNADHNAYFDDTPLEKGIDYYIAPYNDLDDYCGEVKLVKVNVNAASRDELMELNGVGATIAAGIIAYRAENGPFTYLEQLKKVSGIGNANFEKLKNQITLK